MGKIDISRAERPTRGRVGGTDADRAARFRARMPPAAKRSIYIRNNILNPNRQPPVNPERTEIVDSAATSDELKKSVREMGADVVGVAKCDPRFVFTQAGELNHEFVVVFGIAMSYDNMADIGPRSQDEVHRVYHKLADIGVRLAQQIAAHGYKAAMQPNEGDLPLVAMAHLAGLGELGKHGSLISPELGSSFRLGAVSTQMPLRPDGPQDFGIDEVCTKCGVLHLPFSHRRSYRPPSMEGCHVVSGSRPCGIYRLNGNGNTNGLVCPHKTCLHDSPRQDQNFIGRRPSPDFSQCNYRRPGIENPVPHRPAKSGLFS
jgi:hypothetical protein